MKAIFTLFTFLFFIIISCENRQETMQKEIIDSIAKKQADTAMGYVNTSPESYSKGDNKEALKAILSEPKVTDAIITDANVLYASVNDDGSNRDGYASYLCNVLIDFKSPVRTVKIVKTNSSKDPNKDNAYGVLLGQSDCK